jgi:hypothetical protein
MDSCLKLKYGTMDSCLKLKYGTMDSCLKLKYGTSEKMTGQMKASATNPHAVLPEHSAKKPEGILDA